MPEKVQYHPKTKTLRFGLDNKAGSKAMKKLVWATLLALMLVGSVPAWPAREITVDFETGKMTTTEDQRPPDPEAENQTVSKQREAARDIARLQRIVQQQNRVIQQQQTVIRELQARNRRLNDVNRGLELMLRSCSYSHPPVR
jgi:TolA-binding protein